MRQPCLRPLQVLHKSRSTRLISRRSSTASPDYHARPVEPVVEEPSKEQSSPKWLKVTGLGILGTGIIGSILWLAYAEESRPLQLDVFQDYELLKSKRISATGNLLTIQPSTFGPRAYASSLDNQTVAEAARKGIWSVQIKHPLLTIARLYTPLPPFLSDIPQPTNREKFGYISDHPEENQLRFLIRNNPEGELSKYLSRMQAGSRLELRGPYQEFELPDGVEHIVFLAGGTGISPAIQMAHSLLESQEGNHKPQIDILWANRRAEDCSGGSIEPSISQDTLFRRVWSILSSNSNQKPKIRANPFQSESPIVTELSTIRSRYAGTLDVSYFADDQERFITEHDIQQRLRKSAPRSDNRTSGVNLGKNLVLISGPDGFVEHFAGPKVWKEGKELQGNLGGLLQTMDLHGWTVWKL